ncbi:hypothetical protein RR48_14744 [Papilio machaon]|uniref:Uncharacterized protein n=1 Tax=Papilio machaon TaxID=76193 RepID=A0A194R1I7_PAPMA|nr:hypothetical protein RR48_14744 [Papilio machaon]
MVLSVGRARGRSPSIPDQRKCGSQRTDRTSCERVSQRQRYTPNGRLTSHTRISMSIAMDPGALEVASRTVLYNVTTPLDCLQPGPSSRCQHHSHPRNRSIVLCCDIDGNCRLPPPYVWFAAGAARRSDAVPTPVCGNTSHRPVILCTD